MEGMGVRRYPLSLMFSFFAWRRPWGRSPFFLLLTLGDYWWDVSGVETMGTILDHFLLGLMGS